MKAKRIAFACIVYHIWTARNRNFFYGDASTSTAIGHKIKTHSYNLLFHLFPHVLIRFEGLATDLVESARSLFYTFCRFFFLSIGQNFSTWGLLSYFAFGYGIFIVIILGMPNIFVYILINENLHLVIIFFSIPGINTLSFLGMIF